jgi:hypothetical protein
MDGQLVDKPLGTFGEIKVSQLSGKLVIEIDVNEKSDIDAIAAKIGGVAPAIATFLEGALGITA